MNCIGAPLVEYQHLDIDCDFANIVSWHRRISNNWLGLKQKNLLLFIIILMIEIFGNRKKKGFWNWSNWNTHNNNEFQAYNERIVDTYDMMCWAEFAYLFPCNKWPRLTADLTQIWPSTWPVRKLSFNAFLLVWPALLFQSTTDLLYCWLQIQVKSVKSSQSTDTLTNTHKRMPWNLGRD